MVELIIEDSKGKGTKGNLSKSQKIIEQNENPPTLIEMIIEPDIYIPIISLLVILFIAFFLRKKFLK